MKQDPDITSYNRALVCITLTYWARFAPELDLLRFGIQRYALEVFDICREIEEQEPESVARGTLRDAVNDLQVKAARALLDLEQQAKGQGYFSWNIRAELPLHYGLDPVDCGIGKAPDPESNGEDENENEEDRNERICDGMSNLDIIYEEGKLTNKNKTSRMRKEKMGLRTWERMRKRKRTMKKRKKKPTLYMIAKMRMFVTVWATPPHPQKERKAAY
jgi:hypothetical protein